MQTKKKHHKCIGARDGISGCRKCCNNNDECVDICMKGPKSKNILNKSLKVCSLKPLTGYRRDGFCRTDKRDYGNHLVCAKMNKKFLDFTASMGNNLRSVVEEGDKWCLCQERWLEAYNNSKAPKVIKSATNNKTKKHIKNLILLQNGGKRKTQKKQHMIHKPHLNLGMANNKVYKI